MNNQQKNFTYYIIIVAVAVFFTAFSIKQIESINAFIQQFINVLTPFFIGFGLAYVLGQPIKSLTKRFKLKHSMSLAVVYLSLIIIISLISAYLMPIVISNTITFANQLPNSVDKITNTFNNVDWGPLNTFIQSNINRIAELLTYISNFIFENLSNFLIGFGTAFMNIFFGIIISIYLLLDKDNLIKVLKKVTYITLGKHKGDVIKELAIEANDVFSHYIIGLIIESLTVGVLAYIGFKFMGVQYASTLAVIITVTNVIPYIGPFIGAIPAVTVTAFYNPMLALYIAIFIAVLQQIDANIIGPRIMGNFIGLSPIWIILSITVGGGLFGVLGVLLAIPTGALLKIIFTSLLNNYNKSHYNIDVDDI